MYILQVIPLIKLPSSLSQTLTYYSAKKVLPGTLIVVQIRTSNITAIVWLCQELTKLKYELKHQIDYQPKSIEKSFCQHPLLTSQQLSLSRWISDYYASPQGPIIKWFLPRLSNKIKRYPKILELAQPEPNPSPNQYQLYIFMGNLEQRLARYKQIVQASSGQVLILVPEIILLDHCHQWLQNFNPQLIHSQLSTKAYRQIWQEIKTGQSRIILGTRIALFFPFYNLEHIILEDEPSESYYSTEAKPHYQTSRIARQLAKLHNCKLTLASLIPSLQTIAEAHQNKLSIPDVYYPKLSSSKTKLIRMQNEFKKGHPQLLSGLVIQAIQRQVQSQQSSIIYVNRRGEALYLACQECGYHFRDPKTGSLLTVHQTDTLSKKPKNYFQTQILVSHQTYTYFKMPQLCPQCKSCRLKQGGIGIEKIQQYIQYHFPEINHLVLSTDTAPEIEKQKEIIAKFLSKKPQILLTTRMIHKFLQLIPPSLTIIPSVESILNFPDYSIKEKSTQILAELLLQSSQTYIQTFSKWNPEEDNNLAIQTLLQQPLASIWGKEYKDRALFHYPPIYEIIALHSKHKQRERSLNQALRLKKTLQSIGLRPLGPTEKYLAKGPGLYQFTLQIQAKPKLASQIKKQIQPMLEYGQEIEINPEA